MKRIGNLYASIAEWTNLRMAVAQAMRGKRGRPDAISFVHKLDQNLSKLRSQLSNHSFQPGGYRQFTIYDPKERLISAPCFEERVMHHALMNICEPIFERLLIFDTYACRRGKGREACLLRAREYSSKYSWFLKLDVRKYFDSICHDRLLCFLGARFKDSELMDLFQKLIATHQVSEGRGLPIGSLTSQHFANFYLAQVDRCVKEQMAIPGYVRYMDDIVLWHDSSKKLQDALRHLTGLIDERLGLNFKTPYLNRTRHGINFLGARVYPTHIKLNRRSKNRFRRKIRELGNAFRLGRLNESEFQRRAQSLVAFTTAAQVRSWYFRHLVLYCKPGDNQGRRTGAPRRQLDQQWQELPIRQPQ